MQEGFYWCQHPQGQQHVALFSAGRWWVPGVAEPVRIDPDHVLWPVVQPGFPGSPALEVDRRIN